MSLDPPNFHIVEEPPDDTDTSGNAGMVFISKILTFLGLLSDMRESITLPTLHSTLSLALAMIYRTLRTNPSVLDTTKCIREDPVLRTLVHLLNRTVPDQSTYNRFLLKLDPSQSFDVLRRIVRRLKNVGIVSGRILIFDATFIEVNPKAGYRGAAWGHSSCSDSSDKAYGYKLYTVLDLVSGTIIYHELTPGNTSDAKMLRVLYEKSKSVLGANTIRTLIFDKGFYDGAEFEYLDKTENITFITLAKEYSTVKEQIWDVGRPILARLTVHVKNKVYQASEKRIALPKYHGEVRMITSSLLGRMISERFVARDEDGKRWREPRMCHIITNNRKLPVEEIVELYSRRWDIETAFKNSKSGLNIERFPTTNLQGMKNHVAFTLIGYDLINIMRLVGPEDLKHASYKKIRERLLDRPATIRYDSPDGIPRLQFGKSFEYTGFLVQLEEILSGFEPDYPQFTLE